MPRTMYSLPSWRLNLPEVNASSSFVTDDQAVESPSCERELPLVGQSVAAMPG